MPIIYIYRQLSISFIKFVTETKITDHIAIARINKKQYHKFCWSVMVKHRDLISLCNRNVFNAVTTKISDMEKTIKTVKNHKKLSTCIKRITFC